MLLNILQCRKKLLDYYIQHTTGNSMIISNNLFKEDI